MNKNLAIAVGVFVVLLVIVAVLRNQSDKVGVKELSIKAIDKDKVSKVEVTLPAKEKRKPGADAGPADAAAMEPAKNVVLERDGAIWRVYDPAAPDKKYPADENQASTMVEAIGEFKTGDLISDKAEKLADLEIDDAKAVRIKVSVDGGKAMDLMFGRAAKGGGSTVREAGSNDVFIAKGRLGAVLKKDVSQWRKKQLVDVKADAIEKIVVKPKEGVGYTATLISPPASEQPPDAGAQEMPRPEWKLTEPTTLPAGFRLDDAQVARAGQNFAALRATEFAEGVTDEAAGFAGPHTIVEGHVKEEGKGRIVVHLGGEDDKKRVYAKVEGDPQVYLLSSYTAKQAGRPLDDLRDFSIVDAKAEDIEKVTFKSSTGTVIVEKKGEEWKLIEPKVAPPEMDLTQLPTQVASLTRLKASRLAPAGAAATGLDKASPTIEIVTKGGKKQLVRFGAGVPLEEPDAATAPGKDAKKDPREFYVKGGFDDLTYVVAAFTRNRYDKPKELFKKPPAPPQGLTGGPGGGMPGLDGLPPDVRKKLEESLKKNPPH